MKQFFTYTTIFILLSMLLLALAKQFQAVKFGNTAVDLQFENNVSLTYPQVIEAYENLAKKYGQAKLFTYGKTDIGLPLHLFVISKSGVFNPETIRKRGYRIVMVNNGIHPGEPCGIDASIKLANDILSKKIYLWDKLDSTVICIVPVYNIDGALNRSPFNRANQNGPEEQGFRANARNLDLNRDFAPMSSLNAQSFAKIFHAWKPHILIDTHTTNGADYQYVMTLISTHPQELPPMLGNYYDKVIEPHLYQSMKEVGYEMIPYVSPMGQTPESGLQQYYNPPRYTTGYGRVFNTITLMTEAHMFKTFSQRVLATYEFLRITADFVCDNGFTLKKLRDEADNYSIAKNEFVLFWQLDTVNVDSILFKGYEAEFVDSKITGGKRLRYDRDKPYQKYIPYFRYYTPSLVVSKPEYYVVPQAWHEAIHRLSINGVKMHSLASDTLIEVDAYYIVDYKTYTQPYNGHYLHYDVKIRTERQKVQFYKGDYLIYANQPVNHYIVEMLEPNGYDSFFAWNFFDGVLQRKEYFSPYVFEDFAFDMLIDNPKLKDELEERKKYDKEFALNSYSQLLFLYERSPYFEKTYMRYPIFRSPSN